MRKKRTIFGLILSIVLMLSAVSMVAAESNPLIYSSFTPSEIASAGGESDLEMPFSVNGTTVGNANVFCIAHPNTIAPNWPASGVTRQGDIYTLTTGTNSFCRADEVEYSTPNTSASSSDTSKEALDLDLSFGPLPAGNTYTFTLRQIQCSGGWICREAENNVQLDLSVAAPTAIQLDNFNTIESNQLIIPALLLLMALGSLGYVAATMRQK